MKRRATTISVLRKRGRIHANLVAPKLIRNEFGGSVGGPIYIPKLYDGRNRTFFFFAYERFSLRRASQQLMYVPTVAMRSGDFSGLINSAGILQQLYDPNSTQSQANQYSRLPFANNQIPLSRISPLAKTLLAATPLPTSADNPMVNFNLNGQNPTTQTVPNYTVRLDHVFNEKNRVYFRFTDIRQEQQALRNYPSNSPANIETPELKEGSTGYQAIPVQTISGALGYSKTLLPHLLLRDDSQHAVAAHVRAGPRGVHGQLRKAVWPAEQPRGILGFRRSARISSCLTAARSGTTA